MALYKSADLLAFPDVMVTQEAKSVAQLILQEFVSSSAWHERQSMYIMNGVVYNYGKHLSEAEITCAVVN